jgi:hypothetical protein
MCRHDLSIVLTYGVLCAENILLLLYRMSDRRLSAKLVPTFADRGCRVVSAADP